MYLLKTTGDLLQLVSAPHTCTHTHVHMHTCTHMHMDTPGHSHPCLLAVPFSSPTVEWAACEESEKPQIG